MSTSDPFWVRFPFKGRALKKTHAVACQGMARHAMACHGMPRHATACHGMPRHGHAMSRHVLKFDLKRSWIPMFQPGPSLGPSTQGRNKSDFCGCFGHGTRDTGHGIRDTGQGTRDTNTRHGHGTHMDIYIYTHIYIHICIYEYMDTHGYTWTHMNT